MHKKPPYGIILKVKSKINPPYMRISIRIEKMAVVNGAISDMASKERPVINMEEVIAKIDESNKFLTNLTIRLNNGSSS